MRLLRRIVVLLLLRRWLLVRWVRLLILLILWMLLVLLLILRLLILRFRLLRRMGVVLLLRRVRRMRIMRLGRGSLAGAHGCLFPALGLLLCSPSHPLFLQLSIAATCAVVVGRENEGRQRETHQTKQTK